MGWRYQPVVRLTKVGSVEDLCVSMCEVYLNDDDTLHSWTACLAVHPMGNNLSELIRDITTMWMDAMCWTPVMAEDMKPGMSFHRAVDQQTRNELADFIDGGGAFLKSRAKNTDQTKEQG